jgi:flagellar basal-body rod modification protein FlgD
MSTIGSQPVGSTSGGTNTLTNPKAQLGVNDFISMMVTQLQNQDPLSPESNSDLMQQMSQIGQMQASTQLETTLTTVAMQSNLAAAGNLIGKTVQGVDATSGAAVQGVVDSVKVVNNSVSLELDSGNELSMSNVTAISPGPSATTPATPAATAPTTPTQPAATAPIAN